MVNTIYTNTDYTILYYTLNHSYSIWETKKSAAVQTTYQSNPQKSSKTQQ